MEKKGNKEGWKENTIQYNTIQYNTIQKNVEKSWKKTSHKKNLPLVILYKMRIIARHRSLTGESRFHLSTPQGFEPVTLVTGSQQVSPLDQ